MQSLRHTLLTYSSAPANINCKIIDKAIGQFCIMMEHGFAEDMNAQEDLTSRQADQEGWIGRIKGAIAGDEKAEPYHFKSQVFPLLSFIINTTVSRPTK